MEMVKTEVKLMLEKLRRKTDDEEKLASQILLDLNQGDQLWNEMSLYWDFKRKTICDWVYR